MKSKMRGVIDPLSLGFVIALVGGALAYSYQGADEDKAAETAPTDQPTEVVSSAIDSGDGLFE